MTTYLSDHNKAGFEHWAKLNNLKEAARTFNYLSEHTLFATLLATQEYGRKTNLPHSFYCQQPWH